MTKTWLLTFALLIAPLTFVGCGGGSDETEKPADAAGGDEDPAADGDEDAPVRPDPEKADPPPEDEGL